MPFLIIRMSTAVPHLSPKRRLIGGEPLANHQDVAAPLKSGNITESSLAEVQHRREWPVRVVQRMQSVMQNNLLAKVLASEGSTRVPWIVRLLVRIPILRDLPTRLIAFGPRRVHLEEH